MMMTMGRVRGEVGLELESSSFFFLDFAASVGISQISISGSLIILV